MIAGLSLPDLPPTGFVVLLFVSKCIWSQESILKYHLPEASSLLGDPCYDHGLAVIPNWSVITPILKCGMKLLINFKTSLAAPGRNILSVSECLWFLQFAPFGTVILPIAIRMACPVNTAPMVTCLNTANADVGWLYEHSLHHDACR